MRHSAISWWANSGIPLADVRDRAGHSNISVTSRYIHAMPADADPFAAFFGEAEAARNVYGPTARAMPVDEFNKLAEGGLTVSPGAELSRGQ